jgi:hypothetical protein
VAGSCEHGNEHPGYITYRETLQQRGDCWLLTKESASRSQMVLCIFFINANTDRDLKAAFKLSSCIIYVCN